MTLSKDDAIHVAKVFEDYFGNFNRIDEYMRDQKMASLAELPMNPLFAPEDDKKSGSKSKSIDDAIEADDTSNKSDSSNGGNIKRIVM
jgi:hypothetical protein